MQRAIPCKNLIAFHQNNTLCKVLCILVYYPLCLTFVKIGFRHQAAIIDIDLREFVFDRIEEAIDIAYNQYEEVVLHFHFRQIVVVVIQLHLVEYQLSLLLDVLRSDSVRNIDGNLICCDINVCQIVIVDYRLEFGEVCPWFVVKISVVFVTRALILLNAGTTSFSLLNASKITTHPK